MSGVDSDRGSIFAKSKDNSQLRKSPINLRYQNSMLEALMDEGHPNNIEEGSFLYNVNDSVIVTQIPNILNLGAISPKAMKKSPDFSRITEGEEEVHEEVNRWEASNTPVTHSVMTGEKDVADTPSFTKIRLNSGVSPNHLRSKQETEIILVEPDYKLLAKKLEKVFTRRILMDKCDFFIGICQAYDQR